MNTNENYSFSAYVINSYALGPVSTAATCDIQSGKIAVNDMVKFLSADGTVILDNIPLRAIICTTGRPKELTKEIAPHADLVFPKVQPGISITGCLIVKE